MGYHQGWRFYINSGQPVSVFDHPYNKKRGVCYTCGEFQILIASHPVTGHYLEDFGLIILICFYQVIFSNARDLSELCLHHAIEDLVPSASPCVKGTPVFWGLCGSTVDSCPLLYWSAQICTQNYRSILPVLWKEEGQFAWPAVKAFPCAAQETAAHLCHKDALHCSFSACSLGLRSFFTKQVSRWPVPSTHCVCSYFCSGTGLKISLCCISWGFCLPFSPACKVPLDGSTHQV